MGRPFPPSLPLLLLLAVHIAETFLLMATRSKLLLKNQIMMIRFIRGIRGKVPRPGGNLQWWPQQQEQGRFLGARTRADVPPHAWFRDCPWHLGKFPFFFPFPLLVIFRSTFGSLPHGNPNGRKKKMNTLLRQWHAVRDPTHGLQSTDTLPLLFSSFASTWRTVVQPSLLFFFFCPTHNCEQKQPFFLSSPPLPLLCSLSLSFLSIPAKKCPCQQQQGG